MLLIIVSGEFFAYRLFRLSESRSLLAPRSLPGPYLHPAGDLDTEQYMQIEGLDMHDHPKFTLRWRWVRSDRFTEYLTPRYYSPSLILKRGATTVRKATYIARIRVADKADVSDVGRGCDRRINSLAHDMQT